MGYFLDDIQSRINDEIESVLLFAIPLRAKTLYEQPEPLFGRAVYECFPAARFDIEEAGKCLGLERSTACVYHVMRALETGLFALCRAVKPDVYGPNWNRSLNDFDKALAVLRDELQKEPQPKPKERAELIAFYSEASALLRNVKNAWRNSVMHMEAKYTTKEARRIFGSSKAFMEFLATRLREPDTQGTPE